MKNNTHILTLFFMLLVILTSTISASGNSSEKGKTSCSKQDYHSEKNLVVITEKSTMKVGV